MQVEGKIHCHISVYEIVNDILGENIFNFAGNNQHGFSSQINHYITYLTAMSSGSICWPATNDM